jgi:TonB family protein
MSGLRQGFALTMTLLLMAGVLSASEDVVFQVRFFRGTWGGDQPEMRQEAVLSASSRPESSLLRNKAGGPADEFTAAILESLMDIFKPRSLEALFSFNKPWDRRASVLNESILQGQSSFRVDIFPRMLSLNKIGLRLVVKSQESDLLPVKTEKRELLKDLVKNKDSMRQILERNIVLEAGDPILIGIPADGYAYFLVIVAMGGRQEGRSENRPDMEPAHVLASSLTPTRMVKPTYPEELKRQGVKGEVFLQVGIDREGSVQGVKVVKPLHPYLDNAAVEALRQWRFNPILRNGQPVSGILTMSIRFDPESDLEAIIEDKGANVDSGPCPSGPLPKILNQCAEYCRKLADLALDFVCIETIEEVNYKFIDEETMRKRNIYVSIIPSGNPGLTSRVFLPFRDHRSTERNRYVCDFQLIKKNETIEERRILLEDNGRKFPDRSRLLEEKRFSVIRPLFALINIFAQNRQSLFAYTLLDEKNVDGVLAYIVEAVPKSGNENGINKARIWVDQKSFRIHKCEIEGIPLEGFERLLDEITQFNLSPMFVTTHSYRVEKNGILFPSRSIVRVDYPVSTTGKLLKQKIEMNYDRYRFFSVETEARIK